MRHPDTLADTVAPGGAGPHAPLPGFVPLRRAAANSPQAQAFGDALLAGLLARPRTVSPKWFYDAEGSRLFERICELPEYYPTRTELALLERHGAEMAACIGEGAELVEFGAGAVRKVRLLLQALRAPRRFVPVDISGEHLHEAAARLRREHPGLVVEPVVGDFTGTLALPAPGPGHGRRAGFFPGGSIGNFEPDEARALLRRFAGWLAGGGLLIGVDLVKDPALLHAAYNDAQGVTAAFNRNLLARANRELGAGFDLAAWHHHACWRPDLQRIEMHLVAARTQAVQLMGRTLHIAEGDSVHTENSCKYTVEGFQALARSAGLEPRRVWVDARRLFSVHWLEPVR